MTSGLLTTQVLAAGTAPCAASAVGPDGADATEAEIVARRLGQVELATCDVCGEMVAGEAANLLWRPPEIQHPGEFYEYRIACKQPCTAVVDNQYGYQHSQTLDAAIGYLLNNTEVDQQTVNRKIELLAEL